MTRRMAILGAGPIGLEAALHAAERGWDVQVYESGEIGEHVRHWGHVTFFSPWALNRSALAESRLKARGVELADEDEFPTGAQFVARYLEPLAADDLLSGRIHTQTEVLGVSRKEAFKGQFIGNAHRGQLPFVLLIRDANGERYVEADVVIDATGSYDQPNALGAGGLDAIGERALGDGIERYVPDVLGEDRAHYANLRTLVVGHGYSAITSVSMLLALRDHEADTQVFWSSVEPQRPYEVLADDPLPQRATLASLGNDAASGQIEGITPLLGTRVVSLAQGEQGIDVVLDSAEGQTQVTVDRVIANVGYKPDTSLYRELQVHLCYASEGPMKLAAALLSSGGGGGDCLQQVSQGVETLFNPEPDFYVLGAKSYGRNSAFLLKIGREQIQAILEHLDEGESSAAE